MKNLKIIRPQKLFTLTYWIPDDYPLDSIRKDLREVALSHVEMVLTSQPGKNTEVHFPALTEDERVWLVEFLIDQRMTFRMGPARG